MCLKLCVLMIGVVFLFFFESTAFRVVARFAFAFCFCVIVFLMYLSVVYMSVDFNNGLFLIVLMIFLVLVCVCMFCDVCLFVLKCFLLLDENGE